MKKLLIEPHFLGCVEYFCLIQHYQKVAFEINDHFLKQTYRNRCYLLGSNRTISLNVPLKYKNKTVLKDVTIDYTQRWIKDHWGALYSSYGKAPFFDFFADDFKKIWDSKPEFLVDLNMKFISLCFKLLKIDVDIEFTEAYQLESDSDHVDLRNVIHPKIDFSGRNIYQPVPYSQLFGNRFAANLSVIDLIMCEGPQAREILSASFRGNQVKG